MMTCGAFSIFNSSLKLIKEKIMMCDENTIFFVEENYNIWYMWEWEYIYIYSKSFLFPEFETRYVQR